MKKLMSSRPSGLAIIEVILVMSISALLFGVVIGTFATRRKAASDDAARQVMSEIAKVRNQAQQGQGASTGTIPTGNEMFGQAIILAPNSSDITVHKLMQSRTDSYIRSYESYTIKMPGGLKWYIAEDNDCSNQFSSCYGVPPAALGMLAAGDIWLRANSSPNIILVFRNNTGQSYALSVPDDGTIGSGPERIQNYTTSRQGKMRLAFGIPGTGDTDLAKFASGSSKYYANFDLSIPNNQSLQVVK